MDDAAQRQNEQQLAALVDETGALSAVLKRRIKALERQGGSGRDGQIRKQQVRRRIPLANRGVHSFALVRPVSSSPNSSRQFKTTKK